VQGDVRGAGHLRYVVVFDHENVGIACHIGFGLGGALGGLIAAHGLNGFVVLFLANAVTYVLYIAILVLAVRGDPRPAPRAGGYRLVIRDRPFIQLALTNIAMIAVGWGVYTWIMPPYARTEIGVSTRLIGLLFLANALTVALAQIPVAKLAEGRRRAVAMATAALAFVAACLLLLVANFVGFSFAYGALLVAAIAVALGECFYSTALYPLVADMAPPALRGRYMATIGMSWWLGLALAPTAGTQLLGVSPSATMLTAAGVALAAGLSALALERRLPAAIRLTPSAAGPRPRRGRRRSGPPSSGGREP
jgi:MFS family permease